MKQNTRCRNDNGLCVGHRFWEALGQGYRGAGEEIEIPPRVKQSTRCRNDNGLCIGHRVLGHQLHLDPDDFADYEISDRLQYDAGDQQGMADGIGEQRTNETGIEHKHHRHDDGGHAHQ